MSESKAHIMELSLPTGRFAPLGLTPQDYQYSLAAKRSEVIEHLIEEVTEQFWDIDYPELTERVNHWPSVYSNLSHIRLLTTRARRILNRIPVEGLRADSLRWDATVPINTTPACYFALKWHAGNWLLTHFSYLTPVQFRKLRTARASAGVQLTSKQLKAGLSTTVIAPIDYASSLLNSQMPPELFIGYDRWHPKSNPLMKRMAKAQEPRVLAKASEDTERLNWLAAAGARDPDELRHFIDSKRVSVSPVLVTFTEPKPLP
jgi:hypothetical protein